MIRRLEIDQRQIDRHSVATFFRKETLIAVALCIAAFNFGLAINDFVQVGKLHQPENSSQEYTLFPLVSNVIAFFGAALGMVYSIVQKNALWKYLGLIALVWNIAIFVLRLSFEIVYIEFRPETFGPD